MDHLVQLQRPHGMFCNQQLTENHQEQFWNVLPQSFSCGNVVLVIVVLTHDMLRVATEPRTRKSSGHGWPHHPVHFRRFEEPARRPAQLRHAPARVQLSLPRAEAHHPSRRPGLHQTRVGHDFQLSEDMHPSGEREVRVVSSWVVVGLNVLSRLPVYWQMANRQMLAQCKFLLESVVPKSRVAYKLAW